MPYKFETQRKKIPGKPGMDLRRKLSDEQRREIIKLSATLSNRQLASKFGVSRRLIQFILHPDRKPERKRPYYDREQHREYMRRHRQHKKALDKNGLLDSVED